MSFRLLSSSRRVDRPAGYGTDLVGGREAQVNNRVGGPHRPAGRRHATPITLVFFLRSRVFAGCSVFFFCGAPFPSRREHACPFIVFLSLRYYGFVRP